MLAIKLARTTAADADNSSGISSFALYDFALYVEIEIYLYGYLYIENIVKGRSAQIG